MVDCLRPLRAKPIPLPDDVHCTYMHVSRRDGSLIRACLKGLGSSVTETDRTLMACTERPGRDLYVYE